MANGLQEQELKSPSIMAVPGAIASWRRVQTPGAERWQRNREEGRKKYRRVQRGDSCTLVGAYGVAHSCMLCVREGVRERGGGRRDECAGRSEARGNERVQTNVRAKRGANERERERDGESTKLETHYARSAPAVRRSGGQSDTAGS